QYFLGILGRAELRLRINRIPGFSCSQQDDGSSRLSKVHRRRLVDVLKNSHDTQHRGGIDAFTESLIVEADIAARDRDFQFLASLRDAINHLGKLPHDVRFFGISEIKAICRAHRSRSGASYFTRRFRNRMHSAQLWIELAPASIAIEGHRKSAARSLDADDSGVP